MQSWLASLFGTEGFAARSEVGISGIVLLSSVADAVIAASFIIIPAALLFLYCRRGEHDRRARALLTLFILALLSVGLSHFASLFGSWGLAQRLAGVLKALSAVFALTTAIVIWKLMPEILRT